jgi:hypothetical protein
MAGLICTGAGTSAPRRPGNYQITFRNCAAAQPPPQQNRGPFLFNATRKVNCLFQIIVNPNDLAIWKHCSKIAAAPIFGTAILCR